MTRFFHGTLVRTFLIVTALSPSFAQADIVQCLAKFGIELTAQAAAEVEALKPDLKDYSILRRPGLNGVDQFVIMAPEIETKDPIARANAEAIYDLLSRKIGTVGAESNSDYKPNPHSINAVIYRILSLARDWLREHVGGYDWFGVLDNAPRADVDFLSYENDSDLYTAGENLKDAADRIPAPVVDKIREMQNTGQLEALLKMKKKKERDAIQFNFIVSGKKKQTEKTYKGTKLIAAYALLVRAGILERTPTELEKTARSMALSDSRSVSPAKIQLSQGYNPESATEWGSRYVSLACELAFCVSVGVQTGVQLSATISEYLPSWASTVTQVSIGVVAGYEVVERAARKVHIDQFNSMRILFPRSFPQRDKLFYVSGRMDEFFDKNPDSQAILIRVNSERRDELATHLKRQGFFEN